MTPEEKRENRSKAKRATFSQAAAFAPTFIGALHHTPTGTPVELAPRRPLEDVTRPDGSLDIGYHVWRTKSVSVVMLKSGRYGVARVRLVTDPPTRNVQQGPEESSYRTSNLSSGYVHVGEPHPNREEAERAAYALAHKLGMLDGWV